MSNLPLSLSQLEVWRDQQAHPDSPHYNIGGRGLYLGPFDTIRLTEALDRLATESDALRLLPLANGSQQLLEHLEPYLEQHDLSHSADPDAAALDWLQAAFNQPFDLSAPRPPWRIALLKLGPERHRMLALSHHLSMDGYGLSLLLRRLAYHYNALERGEPYSPHPAPNYRAFIDESLAYRDSPSWKKDAAFWRDQLGTLPEPLLTHRPQAPARDHASLATTRIHHHPLPRPFNTELDRRLEPLGITLYQLTLAALALYFSRTTGQGELLIGIPSLNRGGRRYKETLGMFVGLFPLRLELSEEASVRDLLSQISSRLHASYRHQRYPISAIGQDLQLFRHGRDRLFDLLLSYEQQDHDIAFGDTPLCESYQLFGGQARFPLAVTLSEFHPDEPMDLVLEASADYFDEGEPALLAQRLHHLLDQLSANLDAPLAAIDLLPPEQRRELLDGLHAELPHHPNPIPFISAFEHQAALRPEADALLWASGRLSYAALNRRANRLAHQLRALGVGREAIVAVAMQRAPQTLAALLAVAKAGGAFLPLDPEAPPARLADILERSSARLLLTQQRFATRLAGLHPDTLLLDGEASPLQDPALPSHNLDNPPRADDLAYLLFTSGSTGQPKGVLMEHAALARRLAWLARTYAITPSDRSGQATQLTFDPALIELLLPLTHGGSVALPPPGRLDAEAIAHFAAAFGVTVMAFVPSTLHRFLNASAGLDGLRLRVACCGGEVLDPALAERFVRQTGGQLFNVYGPTEACIFASAHACLPHAAPGPLPLGRPLDDTRLYVLDAALRLQPSGVVGDIWIGGGGLARGYLGAPADDARFIADPFRPGARIYRSGDRGYWDQAAELHFVGRDDRQVKLRGYRIELGEIEAALCADPSVHSAAVRLDGRGEQAALHAWITPATTPPDTQALLHQLRQRLPDYMLPRTLQLLAKLPEGSSGKVDYAALPSPTPTHPEATQSAPRNALEARLLPLWQQALPDCAAIGIHDNFFTLGGDSLAAIALLSSLDTLSGQRQPLSLLADHPTIATLAAALDHHLGDHALLHILSLRDDAPPLYLAASGHGDVMRFTTLAHTLADEFTLHMLQPPLDPTTPRDLTQLATRYADLIAERWHTQGGPPPLLAGFSIGGITMLEVARQLAARGIPLRGLVLLDSAWPRRYLVHALPWRLTGWLVRQLRLQELRLNGRRLGALFSDPGLTLQVCALHRHTLRTWPGATTLLISSGLARWQRWIYRPWRRLLGPGLEQHVIPGHHGSIFAQENVGELARRLREVVREADG